MRPAARVRSCARPCPGTRRPGRPSARSPRRSATRAPLPAPIPTRCTRSASARRATSIRAARARCSARRCPAGPTTGLRATLEAELGVVAFIENDVNLAALAERETGAGVDRDVFALLWLGNGVGASFDVAGDLHRGTFGGAGEIGFLPLSADARALDDAARTSQDLVGAVAVKRLAAAHGLPADDYQGAIEAIAASPDRDLIIDQLGERIAHISLALLATLDPGLLVLAGPTAAVGGPRLVEAVERDIRRLSRWYPDVVATHVEGDAVLAGARAFLAAKVRDELLGTVAKLTM